MGYPQNNNARRRIIIESERYQNLILEALIDIKISLTP